MILLKANDHFQELSNILEETEIQDKKIYCIKTSGPLQ